MPENIHVSIDMATPVVVKLAAYEKENNCKINTENASESLELYRSLRDFVMYSNGEITDITVSDKTVLFTSKIAYFDVYSDSKKLLIDMLSHSSFLNITPVNGDYIVMEVGVNFILEEV